MYFGPLKPFRALSTNNNSLSHRKPLQRSETWTDVIHFVDLSGDSSSSVLNMLQLSERRKQHKTWRHY